MSNIRKLIIVGLAGASLGLGAIAVNASAGHRCHEGGFNKEKSAERMQQRQARLHDQLKLGAEQEPAWKAFTEKMKPAGGDRPKHAELAGLKAPERMERMAAMMQQREGRMAERVAAVKEFYAVLTPAQQQVFDANFMTRHRGGKGHAK